MKLNKYFKLIGLMSILLIIAGCSSTSNTSSSNTGASVSSLENIEIDMDEISSEAKFFEENGIKFFIVKDEDGEIKVAFDACDVCGGLKGYHQEGEDMVCNNCGRHFKISELGSLNVNGGGCWPSYLRHEEKDGKIVISRNGLQKGGKFF